MEQFLVPAGEGTSEYMEKKSRFLGLITPVTTEAEARARLEAVCWYKNREKNVLICCGKATLPAILTTANRRARPVSRF